MLGRVLLTISLLPLACSDRTLDGAADTDTASVERPESGMWSACMSQDDCGNLPLCVFPADEPGFCTGNCAVDSMSCPSSYAPPDNPTCVDLGNGGPTCALDCGGGRGCPAGMRCQEVATPEGARSLCF